MLKRGQMKKQHFNKTVIANYPSRLKGLGLHPLKKQRGLKGGKLGPASAGRTLSKEEQDVITMRLVSEGVLVTGVPKAPARLLRTEYREYIASEEWAKMKQKFLAQPGLSIACSCCGDAGPLDLHHKTYARLGHERMTDLCLVCRDCHKSIHALADVQDLSIKEATVEWQKLTRKKLADALPWQYDSIVGLTPHRPPYG